ncbi:MAG: FAD-binding domain-containing protein [Parvularculaceae bacterium]|nr:FAD-binding domain-containing protein [Parvularculaceae bacterium]
MLYDWTPTREAGLARLADFLPRAGRHYANGRNVDPGPGAPDAVSRLSPWIRRRLITEEEVIRAASAHHGAAAEKFIQEVFWRTYWKGWLEQRPEMWVRYRADVASASAHSAADPDLAAALARAQAGQTGIDCFDDWARTLLATGWLHNHARMWFASIWIFTLRLPWALGADFFFRHLVDADAASNTLSWRWVGGLQTRGKHYVARASNIHQNTNGRYNPAGLLDEAPAPLADDGPFPAPQFPHLDEKPSQPRVCLLITEDDLHPESLPIGADVVAAALLAPDLAGRGQSARHFSQGACEDAARRASRHFGVTVETLPAEDLPAFATAAGVREMVTAHVPVGPGADAMASVIPELSAVGIQMVRLARRYDLRAWPHATRGFFPFKEKIPALLAAMHADR